MQTVSIYSFATKSENSRSNIVPFILETNHAIIYTKSMCTNCLWSENVGGGAFMIKDSWYWLDVLSNDV